MHKHTSKELETNVTIGSFVMNSEGSMSNPVDVGMSSARRSLRSRSASEVAFRAACWRRSFSINCCDGSRCAGLLPVCSSISRPGMWGVYPNVHCTGEVYSACIQNSFCKDWRMAVESGQLLTAINGPLRIFTDSAQLQRHLTGMEHWPRQL